MLGLCYYQPQISGKRFCRGSRIRLLMYSDKSLVISECNVWQREPWTTWTAWRRSRSADSSTCWASWPSGSSSRPLTSRCSPLQRHPKALVVWKIEWSDQRAALLGRHAHCDPQTALQHCAKVQTHRHHRCRHDRRQHGSAQVQAAGPLRVCVFILWCFYFLTTLFVSSRSKGKESEKTSIPDDTFRQVTLKCFFLSFFF